MVMRSTLCDLRESISRFMRICNMKFSNMPAVKTQTMAFIRGICAYVINIEISFAIAYIVGALKETSRGESASKHPGHTNTIGYRETVVCFFLFFFLGGGGWEGVNIFNKKTKMTSNKRILNQQNF